jgi:ABC-type glycerol-3-phosphate transport system substrate-binding protein
MFYDHGPGRRGGVQPAATECDAGQAADNWPDVYWMNVSIGAYSHAARGYTYDLSPLVRRDRFDLGALYPLARTAIQRDGQTFAMPRNINTGATLLYWNRTHFEGAGVPPPTEKTALRDLAANLVRLSRPNEDQWGMEWGIPMSQWPIYAAGGLILNKEGTECVMTSREALEGLTFLHDMIHRLQVMPSSGGSSFSQGKSSTMIQGCHLIGNLQRTADASLRWEVAAAPNPRGTKLQLAGLAFYLMRKGTKNPDPAWAWIRHLLTVPAQTRFVQSNGLQAAVRQANFVPEVQQNPALKFATDHIEKLEPAQVPRNGNAADTIAFDAPNSIWTAEINALREGRSVQETAAEMKRQMDLVLKQPV